MSLNRPFTKCLRPARAILGVRLWTTLHGDSCSSITVGNAINVTEDRLPTCCTSTAPNPARTVTRQGSWKTTGSAALKCRLLRSCPFPSNQRMNTVAALSSAASSSPSEGSNDGNINSNVYPFLLADIGEGIAEVELLQWFVQVGDTVQQFDRVCQVQSDKATVEITSRYDGTVATLCGDAGDMIRVGQPLLYFNHDAPGASTNHATTQAARFDDPSTPLSALSSVPLSSKLEQTAAQDQVAHAHQERLLIPSIASHYRLDSDHEGNDQDSTKETNRHRPMGSGYNHGTVLTSPAVRKLGQDYQIDLSVIHASGPKGRLLKSDVQTYLQEQGLMKQPSINASDRTISGGEPSPAVMLPPATSTTSHSTTVAGVQDSNIISLKGYHRFMVTTMTAALQIPHMSLGDTLDVTELLAWRQCWLRRVVVGTNTTTNSSRDDESTSESSIRISVLAILLKAMSLALHQYPMLNAAVHNVELCQVRFQPSHNIGVAVDTPRGLVVPAIPNIQNKSIVQIQQDWDRLKHLAATCQLSADDMAVPCTFTVSNIGALGVGTSMQAVIVPPQVAMGALGRIQRVPVFVDDDDDDNDNNNNNDNNLQVRAAQLMHVSWAADHRFVDGATLARFHKAVQHYVKHPANMLVHLH